MSKNTKRERKKRAFFKREIQRKINFSVKYYCIRKETHSFFYSY